MSKDVHIFISVKRLNLIFSFTANFINNKSKNKHTFNFMTDLEIILWLNI